MNIDDIKKRLGIYYTETGKDAEIQALINGGIEFLKAAGWPEDDFTEQGLSGLAKEALIIYCKMAQDMSAGEMVMNPVLTAMIVQARNRGTDEN